MTLFGVALYLIGLGLAFMMWRRTGGASMETLFRRNEDDHHQVHRIASAHPHGGTWPEYRVWMREDEERRKLPG